MSFHTLPQDLRDCILSYWSAFKELSLRMEKYFVWAVIHDNMTFCADYLISQPYADELGYETYDNKRLLTYLMCDDDRYTVFRHRCLRYILK